MLRKGFTLIELLIVITIIAILAGAALPYVQDYVEDARISKAKSDLNEIKNALIRWEVDNARFWLTNTTIDDLVGSYLEKPLLDPWGKAYIIAPESSLVNCSGPDGVAYTGDDFTIDFRPPLAVTKAYWVDVNKDSYITDGDNISVRFSRPCTTAATTGYTCANPLVSVTATVNTTDGGKSATLEISGLGAGVTTAFTPDFSLTGATTIQDTASTIYNGPFGMRPNLLYIKAL